MAIMGLSLIRSDTDFGTGLIYRDNGNVADPTTGALVGSYNSSGLVVPDSSLNRVFIPGQFRSQANTNNFTIQWFDHKSFTPVSSISLSNLSTSPVEFGASDPMRKLLRHESRRPPGRGLNGPTTRGFTPTIRPEHSQ